MHSYRPNITKICENGQLMIELLRDAFGEEKLLYILVAELKDSPTTIPTSEVSLYCAQDF